MKGTKPRMTATAEAITRAPPCPAWLGEDARNEWRRVVPELAARRVLVVSDLGSVESYCVAVGVIREASRILTAEGLVVDGKKHPAFSMLAVAQTQARQLAAELGLTPVSRSRPSVRDLGDADADPLVDL